MTSPFLEASALEWLRYSKQCYIVMRERGTRTGRPDILGVTKDKYLVEVEVKRTMADFRADAKKPHRADPRRCHGVRQLYYIVPPAMVEKVAAELPPFAGLLTVNEKRLSYFKLPEIKLVKLAKARPHVGRITDARIWDLMRDMAGNLVTAECKLCLLRQQAKIKAPTP